MDKLHRYAVELSWLGNEGTGTSAYTAYSRSHQLAAKTKVPIAGSSDPGFRGDPTRWNPEELLVASLSACHQLWYLHLCASAGVIVTAYSDDAEGVMVEDSSGGGHFTSVVLKPKVTVTQGSDSTKAKALHRDAHEKCFIANSVNFAVTHEPTILVESS